MKRVLAQADIFYLGLIGFGQFVLCLGVLYIMSRLILLIIIFSKINHRLVPKNVSYIVHTKFEKVFLCRFFRIFNL